MAIHAISLVWDNFYGNPNDKLVLLAAADCAGSDGAFSADHNLIARKCGMTVKQVGDSLKRLAATALIIDKGNLFGEGRVFQISFDRLGGHQ